MMQNVDGIGQSDVTADAYGNWDYRISRYYLQWSLTGSAARMLWGTEDMTFQQLVARLRSRFGSLDMEEKYQAEL